MKEPIKMIFFFFGFAVHYSPFPMQLLIHGVTCVWKLDWQSERVIEMLGRQPPKPHIERCGWKFPQSAGQAALVKHAGSFGPSLSDKYPLCRTAPQVCNPFTICSLHTPGETSLTILWWSDPGFFFHSWQSFKEDITHLSLQAEEDWPQSVKKQNTWLWNCRTAPKWSYSTSTPPNMPKFDSIAAVSLPCHCSVALPWHPADYLCDDNECKFDGPVLDYTNTEVCSSRSEEGHAC